MPLYKVKRKLYDKEAGDLEREAILEESKEFGDRWGKSVVKVTPVESKGILKAQKTAEKSKRPHVSKEKNSHTKKFIESFDED